MEQVLVVARDLLFDSPAPHGFIPLSEAPGGGEVWLSAIRVHGTFARRGSVEDDPRLKQIIPYAVLVQGDRMVLLRRLTGAGERRLHHLYSVGVGGHINRGDDTGADSMLAGARREVLEEVHITAGSMGVIGFVNDESNSVGSVHFGVVFKAEFQGAVPVSREPHELAVQLRPIDEVRALCAADSTAFETWSVLVLSSWDRVKEESPRHVVSLP